MTLIIITLLFRLHWKSFN